MASVRQKLRLARKDPFHAADHRRHRIVQQANAHAQLLARSPG
jgi:hypothetical protein